MDQIDKLILQTQGQEEVKRLKADLDLWDGALRQLDEALKQHHISQQQFDADAKIAAGNIVRLRDEITKLEKATGGFRSGALLQLQYVMDDLINTSGSWERKLASISNNIPGLAMSLGGRGAMQLAGAIGIVSTALIALAPVAAAAWQAMAGGGEGPEPVVKALDAAEERVKRLRGEWERLQERMSPEESGTKKAVEEVIAPNKGAAGKLTGAVAMALGQSGRGAQLTQPELDKLHLLETVARDTAGIPGLGERARLNFEAYRDEINQRVHTEDFNAAAAILARAPTERGARDTLRALARQFPGAMQAAGFKDLAGQLDRAEPEAREEDEEFWNNVEAEMRDGDRRIAERKRRAADLKARRRRAAAALERRTNEDIRFEEQAEQDLERRRKAAARRDAERTRDDIAAMDAEPRFRAQERVTAAAAARGFVGPNAPTWEEADQMASEALRLQGQGWNQQLAAAAAVQRKIQQLMRTQAEMNAAYNQQMQMFGGGPDLGQFSMLPPLWQ